MICRRRVRGAGDGPKVPLSMANQLTEMKRGGRSGHDKAIGSVMYHTVKLYVSEGVSPASRVYVAEPGFTVTLETTVPLEMTWNRDEWAKDEFKCMDSWVAPETENLACTPSHEKLTLLVEASGSTLPPSHNTKGDVAGAYTTARHRGATAAIARTT